MFQKVLSIKRKQRLKHFKQDVLIELSKLFELPHDQKCAVLRENLQELSIEKVLCELDRQRNKNDNNDNLIQLILIV